MSWWWHLPHQHGTGAAYGKGIRPETDNREAIHRESPPDEGIKGVSSSNLGQTQSHPLSESCCFLSNRSPHGLGIAQALNKKSSKDLPAPLLVRYNEDLKTPIKKKQELAAVVTWQNTCTIAIY